MPKDNIEREADRLVEQPDSAAVAEEPLAQRGKTAVSRMASLMKTFDRFRGETMADALSVEPRFAFELRDRFSGIYRDLEGLADLLKEVGL